MAILVSGIGLVAASSPKTDLEHSVSFAVGPVGEFEKMSDGEAALRAVLKRPDAGARLSALLRSPPPAGQLYALLGLRVCDRAAFEKALPDFTAREDTVGVVTGCMGVYEQVRVVAKRIADGAYDRDISRPPW